MSRFTMKPMEVGIAYQLLHICMEKTGVMVFFVWPAVNPLKEVLEKGLVLHNRCIPFWLQPYFQMHDSWFIKTRGDHYNPRSDPVQNTDQSIAAGAACTASRGQEHLHLPSLLCPDELSPVCFIPPDSPSC